MATKASASAFNSYFYQQQHQASNNTTTKQMDSNSISNEPVNDLHLKMSKKIAQLTKVRLL
jgi:hypothetical protein